MSVDFDEKKGVALTDLSALNPLLEVLRLQAQALNAAVNAFASHSLARPLPNAPLPVSIGDKSGSASFRADLTSAVPYQEEPREETLSLLQAFRALQEVSQSRLDSALAKSESILAALQQAPSSVAGS